jgi:osmotically-inducible protein OsmY
MTEGATRPTVVVGLALALGLTLAFAPACRNTAEGVEEDSRLNAEQAREGAQTAGEDASGAARKIGAEAKETGSAIGQAAKEVGGTVADGAKEVATAVKDGAKEVAADVGAGKQTVDIKAALMAAKGIDSSHIEVETDANTRTVTLKGTVPTAAQRTAAERLARDHAAGYEIRNRLTVGKS